MLIIDWILLFAVFASGMWSMWNVLEYDGSDDRKRLVISVATFIIILVLMMSRIDIELIMLGIKMGI